MYIISLFPPHHTPFPPFSPSLISHMVSVDVKHHVYLLTNNLKKGQRSRMGRLLLPLHIRVSSAFFEKVIGRMKDDDVTRFVKADSLILKYGQRPFSRRGIEEHSSSQTGGRPRELGRL